MRLPRCRVRWMRALRESERASLVGIVIFLQVPESTLRIEPRVVWCRALSPLCKSHHTAALCYHAFFFFWISGKEVGRPVRSSVVDGHISWLSSASLHAIPIGFFVFLSHHPPSLLVLHFLSTIHRHGQICNVGSAAYIGAGFLILGPPPPTAYSGKRHEKVSPTSIELPTWFSVSVTIRRRTLTSRPSREVVILSSPRVEVVQET